ncbi:MAG: MATE family efflux transporter [Lachnospiraceae bacterium]|nr:MATE family efflux transporter [Lachnospiraceae bacterium]
MINLKKIYNIENSKLMFTNRQMWALLVPVMLEQFLNSFMGMADTMMVSRVGSAAISAVSLVDAINVLIIQIFAAMATGATIICAQYIGAGKVKDANKVASQVTLTVFVISIALTILGLVFCRPLLSFIFGKIESDVMEASVIYFIVSVISYPFIALFNAGSAFYRSGGESKFPMKVSVISNVLNIVGNAIFIFVFHMGVFGAALATLISRVFCVVVIFLFLRKPKQPIVQKNYLSIRPEWALIGMILAVGIPSGIENGMFQFGKLAIQSSVSTLGTTAIAANAMTIILENINGIAGMAMGIGLMTIVGQCIGAGEINQSKYYIVKVTAFAEIVVITSCLILIVATRPVTYIAGMEREVSDMVFDMMLYITLTKPFVWVLSFVPGYGMRAAGDIKFSMIASTITMWTVRVAICVFLIRVMHVGPIAVWIGMSCDWTIRAIIFTWRFFSNRWLNNRVIDAEN